MKDLADAETYILWASEFEETGEVEWLHQIIDGLEHMRALTNEHAYCGLDIETIKRACIVSVEYNQDAHNERVEWLTSKIAYSLSGTDPA